MKREQLGRHAVFMVVKLDFLCLNDERELLASIDSTMSFLVPSAVIVVLTV
jgi:hypothetical protein